MNDSNKLVDGGTAEFDPNVNPIADKPPTLEDRIQKCEELIQKLEEKVKELQIKNNHTNGKFNPKITYLFLLILSILITVIFSIVGWISKPTVSVEFNVGEIIAGVLAGTGIALAGVAYAAKTTKEYFTDK